MIRVSPTTTMDTGMSTAPQYYNTAAKTPEFSYDSMYSLHIPTLQLSNIPGLANSMTQIFQTILRTHAKTSDIHCGVLQPDNLTIFNFIYPLGIGEMLFPAMVTNTFLQIWLDNHRGGLQMSTNSSPRSSRCCQ